MIGCEAATKTWQCLVCWQTQTVILSLLNIRQCSTHSLFFSLTLAPFLSSSSVTCFLLGWGDATAQCCKRRTSTLLFTCVDTCQCIMACNGRVSYECSLVCVGVFEVDDLQRQRLLGFGHVGLSGSLKQRMTFELIWGSMKISMSVGQKVIRQTS